MSATAEDAAKTIRHRLQSGEAFIQNRGIIAGCTVSKVSTSIRNLSLAAGSFFSDGLRIPCPAMANSALVSPNPGEKEQVCYGYVDSSGSVRFSVTEFGEVVQVKGIAICRIMVPAGNTQVCDPNLASYD